MLSLLELVAQNQPQFQTHKALLILGLQNDFIQPDGKLPVNLRNGFLERIRTLVPAFREQHPNVIWVRTLYEANRLQDSTAGEAEALMVEGLIDGGDSSTDEDDDLPKDLPLPIQSKSAKHKNRALDLLKRVRRRTAQQRDELQTDVTTTEAGAVAAHPSDQDEELFLSQAASSGPTCLPNSPGADWAAQVKSDIEKTDTVVATTHYSAFQGTSLLLVLRARLVTELYICGCISNVSVLATVVDAARHGIRINVVQDCLGYRKQSRHRFALRRMVEFFDANVISSDEVLNPKEDKGEEEEEEFYEGEEEEEEFGNSISRDEQKLQGLVDRMRISDSARNAPHPSFQDTTLNGRRLKPTSPSSATEGGATADSRLQPNANNNGEDEDERFAEKLVQGAKVPGADQNKSAAARNSLVKTKIRMRSRTDKSKKEDDKKSKPSSSKKASDVKSEHSNSPRHSTIEKTPETPIKSPKEASSIDRLRPSSISKSGSIDKLRDTPTKADRSLKSSASQPVLSVLRGENKEKSSTSRMRMALSRSSRSEPKEQPTPSSPSPTNPVDALSRAASAQSAGKVEKMKSARSSKIPSLATLPTLGPGDRICEGDSRIIYDFLPPDLYHPSDRSKPLKDLIFTQLYNEVRWQKMMHQTGEVPRLVCCQGEFGADGSMPVYRHPADQTLPLLHFSPKVRTIRQQAEKLVGHPLNHVLIQLYRSGEDFISEHSDKTLDIVKGSSIVNVSFGAQRTMRLRTKKSAKTNSKDEEPSATNTATMSEATDQRETQRVAMPHNSMFVLGMQSNEKWVHGIMPDKRLLSERSPAETSHSGIRISLTFRHIGTFIDAQSSVIWGQGATSKDQREAQDVINNDEEETSQLIHAFGRENHDSDFDWDKWYGDGSDVLHLHAPPPRDIPILFPTQHTVESDIIRFYFSEAKVSYTICELPDMPLAFENERQVHIRDNDLNHTEISIYAPILVYLDRYYPLDTDARSNPSMAAASEIVILTTTLLKFWVHRAVPTYAADFASLLETLEERVALTPGPYIGGRRFSFGDCAMWPILDEIIAAAGWDGWSEERFPTLTEYYRFLWRKKKFVRELREELPEIWKEKKTTPDGGGVYLPQSPLRELKAKGKAPVGEDIEADELL
ncbi:hypothetical protein DM02DRAFT_430654 [Periconia macrospinosa]|uniref:Fe2OG dioxygenase domain-containing protein n=1 Tax=Periconia macrospinosa TaxID=97972 RepID=A0A2V1DQD9_9PLEO|nr:hypothetical protein DM02DRAFT_430654 [Periconia macrospinosa]